VTAVSFGELRADEAHLDALRTAIATDPSFDDPSFDDPSFDDPSFDDPFEAVLHAHLGSSVRLTG
jgi:hypothetical protein